MKKLLAIVTLVGLTLPSRAQSPADPPVILKQVEEAVGYIPRCAGWLHVSARLSIGLSRDVGDFYTTGARDYYNGQWLSGWGKEIFPIRYDNNEIAFIAAQNVFNADEKGKGAVGATLGSRPVNLINAVGYAAGAASALIALPPWAHGISNYTSIEFGYAYRLQDVPGVYRHVLTVGGQVRIPLDLIHGL